VVAARPMANSNEKQLVAYIIPAAGTQPQIQELRTFLQTKLPEYMVPGAIMVLERLPLTPNGKVDRNALPEVTEEKSAGPAFVAPRTPIEEQMAGIWSEVLRVDKVGIDHNFFDLGGHSLLAIQVIARIRNAFDVELPVRSIFERPTISALAEEILDLLLNSQVDTLSRAQDTTDEETRELMR
jgi:acyl carrier protein